MIKYSNINKLVFLIFLCINISYAKQIELSSNVVSDNQKVISNRYMSYVKKVYVKEGDIVKKGQVLFELDSSSLKTEEEQIIFNKEILNNNYLQSEINFKRYERLFKQDLVSKYDLEQKLLAYKIFNTKLKILNSKLKEIKQRYNYLIIKAPNNALIVQKNIKEGELSIPGNKALVLSDLNSLVIKSEISSSDLKYVTLNKIVDIEIDSMNFKTKGKIISIIPNSQENMHTFILKISFSYSSDIYPSMYANIIINTKE